MNTPPIKKLGKYLHISDLGNLIIKSPDKLPKIGSAVVTEKMVHIGVVNDIFGPVRSPYVSVKLKEGAQEYLSSETILYSLQPKKRRKQKKKRF